MIDSAKMSAAVPRNRPYAEIVLKMERRRTICTNTSSSTQASPKMTRRLASGPAMASRTSRNGSPGLRATMLSTTEPTNSASGIHDTSCILSERGWRNSR